MGNIFPNKVFIKGICSDLILRQFEEEMNNKARKLHICMRTVENTVEDLIAKFKKKLTKLLGKMLSIYFVIYVF